MTGGGRIALASWAGTAAFTLTSLLGVVVAALRPVAFAVATVLFLAGCVLFFWAYAIAVGRSRTDAIGIGGLYFLAGDTAPAAVRRSLGASLAVQIVVAIVTASLALYTSLAFGILVPVYGLGAMGLWGARHGSFEPRADERGR
ncbi:MAG TPA: hypothetical protein VHN98_10205 [Acidimicrobiales bacterium]|nr:hypothetical protein [Acidimicrobiales bacterium]